MPRLIRAASAGQAKTANAAAKQKKKATVKKKAAAVKSKTKAAATKKKVPLPKKKAPPPKRERHNSYDDDDGSFHGAYDQLSDSLSLDDDNDNEDFSEDEEASDDDDDEVVVDEEEPAHSQLIRKLQTATSKRKDLEAKLVRKTKLAKTRGQRIAELQRQNEKLLETFENLDCRAQIPEPSVRGAFLNAFRVRCKRNSRKNQTTL